MTRLPLRRDATSRDKTRLLRYHLQLLRAQQPYSRQVPGCAGAIAETRQADPIPGGLRPRSELLAVALSLVCLEAPSAAAVSSLPIYLVVPHPLFSASLLPL